jgi:hypothetical protein
MPAPRAAEGAKVASGRDESMMTVVIFCGRVAGDRADAGEDCAASGSTGKASRTATRGTIARWWPRGEWAVCSGRTFAREAA